MAVILGYGIYRGGVHLNLGRFFKVTGLVLVLVAAGLLNKHVWVGQETDQPWLRGGSYLVARKIRMFVENWDRDYLRDQENVIGRAKVSGAAAVRRFASSPRPTSPRPAPTGSPPSRPTRTSGWPARSTTAGSGSCAAATPSPTASTRRPGRCSAACSSSAS